MCGVSRREEEICYFLVVCGIFCIPVLYGRFSVVGGILEVCFFVFVCFRKCLRSVLARLLKGWLVNVQQ